MLDSAARSSAVLILAACLAGPAVATCRGDWELDARRFITGQPFDRTIAERVPATVILGRVAPKSKLGPEHRALRDLYPLIDVWFHDRDAAELLRVLFTGPRGDTAPAMLAALETVGADRQAAALRAGMALFGRRYPTSFAARSERVGPYHEPPSDIAKAIAALGPPFGTREALIATLAAYACDRPEIVAWLEAERATMSDRDRVAWLGYRLLTGFEIEGQPDEVARQLEAIPQPYRTLYLVRYADFEVGNGGVEQLFSNSSGAIAGHVPAALRAIGADRHAAIVDQALALFPTPYPTDRAERQAFMGAGEKVQGTDRTMLEDRLGKLTEGWDYDAIEPAAIAHMRREGAVPK